MRLHKHGLLIIFLAITLPNLGFCEDQPAPAQDTKPAIDGGYRLQSADEVMIHSLQVKELADKAFRLDEQGNVNIALLGSLHFGGLTIGECEALVVGKLKKYYVDPDVQLSATALHTETYSVIGSVNNPGIHQMKTRTTLLEAISSAGGLRQDYGPTAVVTREAAAGPIPYPEALTSSAGQSVA